MSGHADEERTLGSRRKDTALVTSEDLMFASVVDIIASFRESLMLQVKVAAMRCNFSGIASNSKWDGFDYGTNFQ